MFRKQLLAIAAILGLILLNRWVFAAVFDTDYLRWYLTNGSLIGLGITFISLVSKDFNKDVDTVSANPCTYLATYLRYLSISQDMFGSLMRLNAEISDTANGNRSIGHEPDKADTGQSTPSSNWVVLLWHMIDSVLLMIWAAVLLIGVFLWIVVVIPLQYFVFLICGAPARYFHPVDYRAILEKEDEKFTLKYIKSSAEIPKGSQDASLGIEPFPLTSLLSILFFEVVKFIVA